MDAGSLGFRLKAVHMVEGQLAGLHGLALLAGVAACAASEDDDIKQRVAHQTVPAMDAPNGFTGHKEVLHTGHVVGGDVQAAVLVVEGGVDQDGLLSDVDAVFAEHPQHGGDALFDGALAVFQLDHRGVQPHADAAGGVDALAVGGALPDDGGSGRHRGTESP